VLGLSPAQAAAQAAASRLATELSHTAAEQEANEGEVDVTIAYERPVDSSTKSEEDMLAAWGSPDAGGGGE
jgi:hypothetical protein